MQAEQLLQVEVFCSSSLKSLIFSLLRRFAVRCVELASKSGKHFHISCQIHKCLIVAADNKRVMGHKSLTTWSWGYDGIFSRAYKVWPHCLANSAGRGKVFFIIYSIIYLYLFFNQCLVLFWNYTFLIWYVLLIALFLFLRTSFKCFTRARLLYFSASLCLEVMCSWQWQEWARWSGDSWEGRKKRRKRERKKRRKEAEGWFQREEREDRLFGHVPHQPEPNHVQCRM